MKVLQILFPSGIGGVERIAGQLSDINGVDSFIAIDRKYVTNFINYFNIDQNKIIPIDCSNLYFSYRAIKKCIYNINPEVIHTHARRETFYACLCKKDIKLIRTQHMAENPKIPILKFEKLLLKKVDIWIATSKELAYSYLFKKKYIEKNKIGIIYNGAPKGIERTEFKTHRRFCVISRLSKQKGIDILIKTVSNFSSELRDKIKIDIWGDGEELQSLLSLIDELHVCNIFSYKGITNNPALNVVKYDALLMPSRYEGLPLTMIECMSTCTPVAIHNVGCVSEFIKTGENGWIINDSYSWENFFKDVLVGDNYRSICLKAKETYEKLFSLEKMKIEYENIYKYLIDG